MMAYKSILHQAADFPSKRLHFHWKTKVRSEEEDEDYGVKRNRGEAEDDSSPDQEQPSKNNPSAVDSNKKLNQESSPPAAAAGTTGKLKSVLTSIGRNRLSSVLMNQLQGGGRRRRLLLVGTLFGPRRGTHVHFVFQKDPTSEPVFLVELATPISSLVREMASGQVRVALECDRKKAAESGSGRRVIDEEGVWRAYLNGKKCGFGNSRRECWEREWEILKCVEAITTGAGVLPPIIGGGDGGEVMYMRAKFERVVGCRDSEALYMMNPADSHAPPELSLYLLRTDG